MEYTSCKLEPLPLSCFSLDLTIFYISIPLYIINLEGRELLSRELRNKTFAMSVRLFFAGVGSFFSRFYIVFKLRCARPFKLFLYF